MITFATKVSLLGGNPGAIVRAELEGAVLIEGPNNLRIDGRNFYFQKGDPNVVYSDDRLRFRADHHFGTAKGMPLELLRDEKAKPDDPISIGGISSIKLLQDVDMTLVSDSFEQSLTPAQIRESGPHARSRGEIGRRAARSPSIAKASAASPSCLATRDATFERNVRIRRETEPAQFDRGGRLIAAAKSDFLAADESVRILFDAKKPANRPGEKPPAAAKEPSSSFGDFRFQSHLQRGARPRKGRHAHFRDQRAQSADARPRLRPDGPAGAALRRSQPRADPAPRRSVERSVHPARPRRIGAGDHPGLVPWRRGHAARRRKDATKST